MTSKSIENALKAEKTKKIKIIKNYKSKLNCFEVPLSSNSQTPDSFQKNISKKSRKCQEILQSFNPLSNYLGITKANFFIRPIVNVPKSCKQNQKYLNLHLNKTLN